MHSKCPEIHGTRRGTGYTACMVAAIGYCLIDGHLSFVVPILDPLCLKRIHRVSDSA